MTFTPAVAPNTPPTGPAYFFAFRRDQLLVHRGKGRDRVPRLEDFGALGLKAEPPQYLGRLDGTPCYALSVAEESQAPADMAFHGLRDLFEALDEAFFRIAGRAVQIVEWDRTHRFCGRCGAPTEDHPSDRAKRCPRCRLQNFPRLSPAIIVRITRGDRILLARSPRFPPGRYSVLAGFVEPGESLEETVAREVGEEVGIQVDRIRYFGSQPWPFPNSLMLGFTARHADGEICIDQDEIEDAGWYRADNLPSLPPPVSIARRLIDDFCQTQPDNQ